VDTSTIHFVEVFKAETSAQAQAVKTLLEGAGIETRVENELLEGVIDELPTGGTTTHHVLVAETQIEQARPLLEQLDASPPAVSPPPETEEGTRCLSCGAEMPENEERCHACGWSYKEG
jgi:hypothetical protein